MGKDSMIYNSKLVHWPVCILVATLVIIMLPFAYVYTLYQEIALAMWWRKNRERVIDKIGRLQ